MLKNIKQIVPQEACLHCDVCCRYLQRTTSLAPYFFDDEVKNVKAIHDNFNNVGCKIDQKTPPVPCKDRYICSYFDPGKNNCKIYSVRPFDCRLYPFMITYDADFKSVALVVDTKCPDMKDKYQSKEFNKYLDYLTGILESEDVAEEINRNKIFINDFQKDSVVLKRLDKISKRLCLNELGLTKISLKDKALFDSYLKDLDVSLSYFSFPAIYVWSGILNILWKEIGNFLCVFAGNNKDYFLLLPPAGRHISGQAVKKSFEILAELNRGGIRDMRIENVPEELSHELESFGLNLDNPSQEYIYAQKELALLEGGRFKSKRSSIDKFVKKHKYRFRPIEEADIWGSLELYMEWAKKRLRNKKDDYYRLLIEDSYFANKMALMNFKALGLKGAVVEVNNKIEAYALGYPLNKDIFVILFEITNLDINGLAQFIFREFCRSLAGHKYISTMSDSGLENLKRAKESYYPTKRPPLFTAHLIYN